MSDPPRSDAAHRLGCHTLEPWTGFAWRAHKRRYAASDPGGSLKVSGRYNRGLDRFSEEEVWPALYLALSDGTSLGEVLRHIIHRPELLPSLNDYRVSKLRLHLEAVFDCRDLSAIGLTPDDLLHTTDYRAGQELAAAAISGGAEGILVPSATGLGDNLVLFPARLRPASRLEEISFRDELRLY